MSDIDSEEVIAIKAEHIAFKKAINGLGEKSASINLRLEQTEKDVREILSVLRENGRIEEQTRVQHLSMAQDIKELTTIFGDIKVSLANNNLDQHDYVDDKVNDVYNHIDKRYDDISIGVKDNRNAVANVTKTYETKSDSDKKMNWVKLAALCIVGAIIFVYKEHTTDMKDQLVRSETECKVDMTKLEKDIKEHKH